MEELAEVIHKLVADKKIFEAVVKAYTAKDREAFHTALKKVELDKYCMLICRWICQKKCTLFCRRLEIIPGPLKIKDVDEIREFGELVAGIISEKKILDKLIEYYEKDDVESFRQLLEKKKIVIYGPQLCYWICSMRCKLRCRILCPNGPQITHIGFIPTSQIDGEGYAMGPSEPLGLTAPPDSCSGHHPFGGVMNIRGQTNVDNPEKYIVEWSSNPSGPWSAITTPIIEKDFSVIPPINRTRYVSGSPNPGWYFYSDMIDKNYLTDWLTPNETTQKFYLRLTVMNTSGALFHSPVVPVRIDNHAPTIETLQIFVKTNDGTERPIKCGGINKGQGILLIRFKAWDENFRSLSLRAEGNSSLSVPIIDQVTNAPVSRCYNGNLLDIGEPTLRTVEWNPWMDKRIIPCCYIVVLRINDRVIINNSFQGGHSASAWEAVEIALG